MLALRSSTASECTRTARIAFDALVGLLGMLNVVLGFRSAGDPPADTAASVEGWILGQARGTDPGSG